MSEFAIKVENITKIYKLYKSNSDRVKEAFHPMRKKFHKDFYALNDVSFEVNRGETVGIVGKNGAGKSTLLKIITGVLSPSFGKVTVNGRIASLLELGAGFNPEFTGLENIYLQGSIMGYSKQEMEKKMADIIEFADIGEYISQEVKTYSSGMFARLAFSVAINVEPDILIVDEALSVGDIRFQNKCYRKINSLKQSGIAVLFVSHDTAAINTLCNYAIWLDGGSVKAEDVPNNITNKYFAFMTYGLDTVLNEAKADAAELEGGHQAESFHSLADYESFGEGGVEILSYSAKVNGDVSNILKTGDKLEVLLKIKLEADVNNPIGGFLMKDVLGNTILGANNIIPESFTPAEPLVKGHYYYVNFSFKFPNIGNGKYLFSFAIADGTQEDHTQLQWIDDMFEVAVVNESINNKLGWILPLERAEIKFNLLK